VAAATEKNSADPSVRSAARVPEIAKLGAARATTAPRKGTYLEVISPQDFMIARTQISQQKMIVIISFDLVARKDLSPFQLSHNTSQVFPAFSGVSAFRRD
jgi:hypothetical protein